MEYSYLIISKKPKTMNEQVITFPDNAPAVHVPLPLLERTTELTEYDRKLPRSRPIHHADLFRKIAQFLESAKQPYIIKDIMVSKAESNRIKKLDPENLGLPEGWVFRRMMCTISLTGKTMEDEESNGAIGITYDTKGIVVAFGQEVRVCSNFSIFGEKVMSTYGKGKYSGSYDLMMEALEQWISKRKAIREEDLRIFGLLKDVQIDKKDGISLLLGKMLQKACAQYHSNDEEFVTITDVTSIAQEFVKSHIGNESKMISGYELYNIGTNILTHSLINIPDKLPRINQMSKFMVEQLLN